MTSVAADAAQQERPLLISLEKPMTKVFFANWDVTDSVSVYKHMLTREESRRVEYDAGQKGMEESRRDQTRAI